MIEVEDVRKRTIIRNCVSVKVHHGTHGAEEVPAHAHHGCEQILEAMERLMEDCADASSPAIVGAEETKET